MSATAEAAPVNAEATAPAEASAPTLTPDQIAVQKQKDAQEAIAQAIQAREQGAVSEIAAICEKYGCELIVAHSVKVRAKQ